MRSTKCVALHEASKKRFCTCTATPTLIATPLPPHPTPTFTRSGAASPASPCRALPIAPGPRNPARPPPHPPPLLPPPHPPRPAPNAPSPPQPPTPYRSPPPRRRCPAHRSPALRQAAPLHETQPLPSAHHCHKTALHSSPPALLPSAHFPSSADRRRRSHRHRWRKIAAREILLAAAVRVGRHRAIMRAPCHPRRRPARVAARASAIAI